MKEHLEEVTAHAIDQVRRTAHALLKELSDGFAAWLTLPERTSDLVRDAKHVLVADATYIGCSDSQQIDLSAANYRLASMGIVKLEPGKQYRVVCAFFALDEDPIDARSVPR